MAIQPNATYRVKYWAGNQFNYGTARADQFGKLSGVMMPDGVTIYPPWGILVIGKL